ncbi:MAG: sugar phosphate isomerase/epimerase family protein [Spirochaetota bacterium]
MGRPVTLFTGQWADLPFTEICRKAGEWGFDGLELCTWGDHFDVHQAAKDSSYVEQHRETLSKNGLGCWSIGSHIVGQLVGDNPDPRNDTFAPEHLAGKPDEIRKWAVDEMMATAAGAKAFGLDVVTGFMGSPIWAWWYSFPPTSEQQIADGYGKVVELWGPIFDEFDKNGVRFALEVHPGEIAYDLYTMERLLEEFGQRPTLGVNFDPSHLIWQGLKPELFYRDMAERIYHVHMKDSKVTLDGRASILGSHLPFGDLRRGWNFVSLGHGSIDFDAIIREVNAAGYTGPLSIEWEDNGMDRERGAQEALEFVRRMNFGASTIAFDGSMEK